MESLPHMTTILKVEIDPDPRNKRDLANQYDRASSSLYAHSTHTDISNFLLANVGPEGRQDVFVSFVSEPHTTLVATLTC